ncbi:hypothetical protein ANAEL_00998 [Anaerolineales bacterium]|nr:hypothetical protein ANAEL_00998 [Anaerolineales bacterium]
MSEDKKTTTKKPVHFPRPGAVEENTVRLSLHQLMQDEDFNMQLSGKNILIFGKVGFFDLILRELKNSYPNKSENGFVTISTEHDLETVTKKIQKDGRYKHPIVLMPAVETQDRLNHLLTGVLELKIPVWLVALPSQISKQLLLSFNWFFISSGPPFEISTLANITPINNEDTTLLETNQNIFAVFAADQKINRLGLPERLGTVVHIHKF